MRFIGINRMAWLSRLQNCWFFGYEINTPWEILKKLFENICLSPKPSSGSFLRISWAVCSSERKFEKFWNLLGQAIMWIPIKLISLSKNIVTYEEPLDHRVPGAILALVPWTLNCAWWFLWCNRMGNLQSQIQLKLSKILNHPNQRQVLGKKVKKSKIS